MPKGLIGKYIYQVMVNLYQDRKLTKVDNKEFIKYFNETEPTTITMTESMLSGYLNNGMCPVRARMEKIENIDPQNNW